MSRVITSSTLRSAQDAADTLLQFLDPVCERVEVAGSVRRRQDEINDVEVVAIAKTSVVRHGGLFGLEGEANLLELLCDRAAAGQVAGLRRPKPAIKASGERPRRFAWGDKYKRLIVLDRGRWYCVDLFITTAAQWGALFAIRTGPAKFSKLLVTPEAQGGAMPFRHRQHHGYLQRQIQSGGAGSGDGEWANIETPEEADYFEALAVPLWEPRARSARTLREYLSR